MSTQDVRVEALLNIRCIVKCYHLCRFEVNVGEVLTANKKMGERGNAFKVVDHRGQLGHLQSELVDPLWPLHADILCCSPVNIKMKCVYNYCVQSYVFYASIPVPSICNQSIPIDTNLSSDWY